ncbi:MAG: hypothetical protein ACREQM_03675 [Candidatus Dormibacteraceae bacterium]
MNARQDRNDREYRSSGAWGRLVVLEREDAFLVAREADSDDWLCRFARRPGFPARQWAENMARTYNRRLERTAPGCREPA